MASINDWAAKAAHNIVNRFGLDEGPSKDKIAAIITTFAEPLVTLLQESRRAHHMPWMCSAAEGVGACDCGAAEWNARVDAVLDGRKPVNP